MTSLSVATRASLGVPRARAIRAGDLVALLVANLVLIVAMWVRHGGLDRLGTTAQIVIGIGQLTALLGTALALVQVWLMSRSPWLDQAFGRDRLTLAHRWVGFATIWLLVGHFVFTTVGLALADGVSPIAEGWTLVTTWDFVLMATVSLALFIAVAVSSVRLARRHVSYETWYGIHLYVYLAIALGFAHQLVVGSDLVDDPVARIYWVGLYVVTIGSLLVFRVGTPIVRNLRHGFRVANVVHEGPGVVSLYLTGRRLDRFEVRAGQYLVVRLMTGGWWRAHPYSVSAQPNGRWLRLTVKALGDDSARLEDVTIGTRAIVEGPYGNLTAEPRTADPALLIAGGIGVTPLRALFEEISAHSPVTLLYRARRAADLIFRDEFDQLADRPGVRVHYLVGGRADGPGISVPEAAAIHALVPDVAEREVYLCGPLEMMARAGEAVRSLGVPASRVHEERFVD